MRSKIRYDMLVKAQHYARKIQHPAYRNLYETAYGYLHEMRTGVLKNFNNICIHGNFPELIIPHLKSANSKFMVHSHLSNFGQFGSHDIQMLDSSIPFTHKMHEQKFDLIVSCLEAHHYDLPKLMDSYMQMLEPNGAILGCCWGENTLKELKWAFLMAQNERSGGISPKVLNFPTLGEIGQSLTSSKAKMPTIVVRDLTVEVESSVDLLSLLQVMGQSGVLQGRRKGVYKDVLLAACAYYDSEYLYDPEDSQEKAEEKKNNSEKNVYFSLQMGLFIGWKEHISQPKPLSPQKVINNSFFQQLIKDDADSKMFIIEEGNDQPRQINIKDQKVQIFADEADNTKSNKKPPK